MHERKFLPFEVFMQKMRYPYNKKLWDTDPMYKAKIWKSRRQRYMEVCKKYNYANEKDAIDDDCMQYELRIAWNQYDNGLIDIHTLNEKEADIKRKYSVIW